MLAWIPKIEKLNGKSSNGDALFIEKNPDSGQSETIHALRTRVQFEQRILTDNSEVLDYGITIRF